MTFLNIYFINLKINKIVKSYMNIEVERLTNNIVSKSVREEMKKYTKSNVTKYYDNDDKRIFYDIQKLNNLKNNITELIQKKLMEIENGEIDEYFLPKRIQKSRFKKIKQGIICDVSIYSLNESGLFANIGPTIPIKLVFSDQLNTNIDVKTKEYGINNVIVETYLIVTIKEQVIMPLSSKRKNIVIREPLTIDIIQGNIPNYYNGYLK